jgi:hypothetical protein
MTEPPDTPATKSWSHLVAPRAMETPAPPLRNRGSAAMHCTAINIWPRCCVVCRSSSDASIHRSQGVTTCQDRQPRARSHRANVQAYPASGHLTWPPLLCCLQYWAADEALAIGKCQRGQAASQQLSNNQQMHLDLNF